MSTIVTRAGKGSPLTHVEVDANFTNLNTDKVEKTAAAITGGTINNTTIGATTPSSVNATTITGQTARVNGTGTNLFIYSQDFTNASWGKTNLTVTTGFVAPDNTSTANKLVENNVTGQHLISQFQNAPSGITYTYSVYAKAAEWTSFQTQLGVGGPLATFNLSAVTASQTGGVSASIISVGNGWFRCSLVGVSNGNGTCYIYKNSTSYAGNNIDGMFVWGAQLEIGSTLRDYVATTTTAVYGTPTLSFSGVSEIGLLSTGALYLQPAGTGALQAQATTSTTAGGNARGANAVDWSTSRAAASNVASGAYSTLAGGYGNTASGAYSIISGGLSNATSATGSSVLGGNQNSAGGTYSSIAGGNINTANGYFNFIGGGFTNSGTANAAVTTQSGTMNATTAVTLSGSNANIKVGQYISGTSIASDTYVAAISGTSLTLSKNASGSSTSTLSFFTPHGVVVGGGNNQATGSYSFIGGGGDAGTAANRNVASGDWSVVCGGARNTASGWGSFIGGGAAHVASGLGSVVCGGGIYGANFSSLATNQSTAASTFVGAGLSNAASGNYAFVGAGIQNQATSQFSAIMGGSNGTVRAIEGNHVFPACFSSVANALGVSQSALLILGRQTTDATATVLTSNASAAGTTNQVILPNNSAYFFRGEVVSGVTGGGDTKGWTIEGVIKRGANAASTALVGTPTVTSSFADAGASTWTIAVTADTTNGGLRVTFTGQASTTIRTVCQIRTTEMTY